MNLLTYIMFVLLTACAPQAAELDSPLTTSIQAPAGGSSFDHTGLDALLKAHVRNGRVDYTGLRTRLPALKAYTARLATADLSKLTRNERLALLINAYNAFTLELMLEPGTLPASIRDLPDPWKQVRWTLAGDRVSLDNIEHGLIRPLFHDPRIHFAVNCASIGCPPLRTGAFTGKGLSEQLDAVTRTTLQNPRYARVEGTTLVLTKILDWYGSDMTAGESTPRAETVAAWVALYSTDEVKALVNTAGGRPTVTFGRYDWTVNGQ